MIGANIYKKILMKMNLSKNELLILKKKLTGRNICYGPFVKDGKMCPTTTALSIKLKKVRFEKNRDVSKNLRKIGINKLYLWLFYITFDLPAMVSRKFFKNRLRDFRKVVDDLISQSK